MKYMSVCSGIEAATVACQHLNWQAVAFAEVESFPSAVLAHHYPDVPNLGDMTTIDGKKYRETVDLVIGGTPCQSFSVAGKRGGMADARGALALAFVKLVRDVSPHWIIWENVPGVFSSGDGADFKVFATALVECGYHVAWRVLDAQFFGVPQRRRRVFLVGYLGNWRPAAAVLFEPESLCGHSAPSRKKASDIAGAFTAGAYSGGADDNRARTGFYVPELVRQAMSCKWSKGTSGPAGDEHHNLICAPLTASRTHSRQLTPEMHVRRLTPRECERLQGFSDDYTAIPYLGKPAADSPRYKALGNSMAVPVVRWLFERIERHTPSQMS